MIPKKRKKPKRSTLKAKADQMFRDLVRARGYCQLAGLDGRKCSGRLETMHIEPRGNYRLRWEPLNALCGCGIGHHAFYSDHPTAWVDLVAKHFPENYAFILAHTNEIWDRNYDRVLEALRQEAARHEEALSLPTEAGA